MTQRTAGRKVCGLQPPDSLSQPPSGWNGQDGRRELRWVADSPPGGRDGQASA